MENLNNVIAKNLIAIRKINGLTQMELAEKLNYSDKSISKWENGEAIPSVEVLVQLGKLFGVGIDYFVKENVKPKKPVMQKQEKNKLIITLLSVSLVWLVALSVFTVFMVTMKINLWPVFVWAVPVMFVVTTVFACLWAPKRKLKYISISCLIWALVSAIYLQFLTENLWMIFIVAVPLQVAVVLWAFRKKMPYNKQTQIVEDQNLEE